MADPSDVQRALEWARTVPGALKKAHRDAMGAMAAARGLRGSVQWDYSDAASCAAVADGAGTAQALRWWDPASKRCVAGDASSVQWCKDAGNLAWEPDPVSGVARCHVTESYCSAKGSYFIDGDCRIDFGTYLMEQLVGVTVSRGINYVLENPDRVLEEITKGALNASGYIYANVAQPVLDILKSGKLEELPRAVMQLGLTTAAYTVQAAGQVNSVSESAEGILDGVAKLACTQCDKLVSLVPTVALFRLQNRALSAALGAAPAVLGAMDTATHAIADAIEEAVPVGKALDAIGATPVMKSGVELGVKYGGQGLDYAKQGIGFVYNNGIAVGLREIGGAIHDAKQYMALGTQYAAQGISTGINAAVQGAKTGVQQTGRGYAIATNQIRKLPGGDVVVDVVDNVGRALYVPQGMYYTGVGIGKAGDAALSGLASLGDLAALGVGELRIGDGLNAAAGAVGSVTQYVDPGLAVAQASAYVGKFLALSQTQDAMAATAAAGAKAAEYGKQAVEYGKQAADALSNLTRLQDLAKVADIKLSDVQNAAQQAQQQLSQYSAQAASALADVTHLQDAERAAAQQLADAQAALAFAQQNATQYATQAAGALADLTHLQDMQQQAATQLAAVQTAITTAKDQAAQYAAQATSAAADLAHLQDLEKAATQQLADMQAAIATAKDQAAQYGAQAADALANLQKLQDLQKIADLKLSDTQAAVTAAAQQAQQYGAQAAQYSAQIATETADLTRLTDAKSAAQAQITDMAAQMQSLTTQIDSAQKALDQIQGVLGTLGNLI